MLRYILRVDAPPIMWAWRLALGEDGAFSLDERIYGPSDTVESRAAGTWNQIGDLVYLTTTTSTCSEFPVGTEATLYREPGDMLWYGERCFEPDMPRIYVGGAIRVELGADGECTLQRDGLAIHAFWHRRDREVLILLDDGQLSLIRMDDHTLVLDGVRLEPVRS